MKFRVPFSITLGALALGTSPLGCSESATPAEVGNQVRISVAPLTLDNVTDACYSLATYAAEVSALNPANYPADDLVWERSPVCASDFGIGTGAANDVSTSGITYIGACDASVATNDIVLILDNLYEDGQSPTSQGGGTGTAVPASDFYNPCTAAEPCVLTRPCLPSEDVNVTFDITVMRDSNKGFFDIGVQFEDIFCSAKFDCGYADGSPIEKIYGTDGELHPTAVLAFTCTAGTDAASHLYMTDIAITCDGGVSQTISPANSGLLFDAPRALPLGAAFPNDAVFQAVTSFGQVENSDFTEYYWTVALGFDLARANNCTLTARASATEGTFADTTLGSGLTPADSTWPVIEFNIPIDTIGAGANQRLTCADNDGFQNKLNSVDSGVFTDYTPINVRRCFDLAYPGNPALIGSVDDAASTATCTADVLPTLPDPCLGFAEVVAGNITVTNGVPPVSVPPISLACLTSVGGITLAGTTPTAVSLPRLTSVGSGGLIVAAGADLSVSAPLLDTISGHLGFGNIAPVTTVSDVDLPALTTIGGGLYAYGATLPNGLALPTLTQITGSSPAGRSIDFIAANLGADLALPDLTASLNGMRLGGGSALAGLDFTSYVGSLANNHSIDIQASVPSVAFPALTETWSFALNGTSATSLSLPLLETATFFTVEGNPLLTTLSAPNLQTTGDLNIRNNDTLPCSFAEAIANNLTTSTSVNISPNNGGTCP